MIFNIKKKSQVQMTSTGRIKTVMPEGMYKKSEVHKHNLQVIRLLQSYNYSK